MIWIVFATAAVASERLSIDAPCGSVRIVGGNTTVQVDGAPAPRNGRLHLGNACTEVVVRVPRASRIDVESISAGLEVVDLTGSVDFESVSGSLVVTGDHRPTSVEAATVSGALQVAVGPGADVDLSTVSGAITVTGGPARSVEAASVSGTLTLRMALQADAQVEAESHSGEIRLTLKVPPRRLETDTFSGRVTNGWVGPLAAEGPSIELETFSSNIVIEQEK